MNTGKEVWKAIRDEKSNWAAPLVVDYKGRKQIVVNATNKIRSYDFETGKVIWECGGLGSNPTRPRRVQMHPSGERTSIWWRHQSVKGNRRLKGKGKTVVRGVQESAERCHGGSGRSHLLKRSLMRVTTWCKKHRHDPVTEQQEALNRMLQGHYQYYGRPTNYRSLWQFYRSSRRIWKKWLDRRNRARTLSWVVFERLLARHPLFRPRITRSWVFLRPAQVSLI